MSEHPISEQITSLLKVHHCWYEAFEHPPVRTSEEASAIRPEYSIEQGAKALIVKAKTQDCGELVFMVVVPGHQKFNSSKVKKLLSVTNIRFVTEDEVIAITDGVKPGGVPPFGTLFGLQVVTDPQLFTREKMIFNAGRTCSIAMKTADYRQLVSPLVDDII